MHSYKNNPNQTEKMIGSHNYRGLPSENYIIEGSMDGKRQDEDRE